MKDKAYDEVKALENAGGGDGPDYMFIEGYSKAVEDITSVINKIKENQNV